MGVSETKVWEQVSCKDIQALYTGWGTCDLLVGYQHLLTAQPSFPLDWQSLKSHIGDRSPTGAKIWFTGHRDSRGTDKLPQISFVISGNQMSKWAKVQILHQLLSTPPLFLL